MLAVMYVRVGLSNLGQEIESFHSQMESIHSSRIILGVATCSSPKIA
jgi:hypothetical protein